MKHLFVVNPVAGGRDASADLRGRVERAFRTREDSFEVYNIEDGHILLDGQLTDRPPLRQVLKEAEAVRNELAKRGWRGEVTPVLAFASDTFEAKIAESGGVVIINSNALEASFASVRTVLPPAELDRLVRLMENG